MTSNTNTTFFNSIVEG